MSELLDKKSQLCYKSFDSVTETSFHGFVLEIIQHKYTAMPCSISVFIKKSVLNITF